MADIEKVKQGLKLHSDGCGYRSYACDYMECPYRYGDESCDVEELTHDALSVIEEQQAEIERLKEHGKRTFLVDETGKITPLPIVTRCKDCEWRGNKKKCILAFVADKQEFPLFFYDQRGEWFCADGKRKEGDGDE